ncbi:heat shock cognate 70 kDa protein [Spatholobus suberectus]|nr:heat shock cognate 70 kDa protein [Spatholobus suberectus]
MGFGRSYHCETTTAVTSSMKSVQMLFPLPFIHFSQRAISSYMRKHRDSALGYDLHPCCLKMKDRVSDEEGRVTLELSQKVPSKCGKCKHRHVVDEVKGWSYVSSGSGGNHCYHVSCVKELILENLTRGYFTQETNSIGMTDREYSQLALRSMEMVQRGGSSRRSGTTKKYTKIAVLVFKLIFSAVFGNPISAIAALVEALTN